MIIEASFDPVTVEMVQAIRNLMKQEGIHEVYVQPCNEGILSVEQRVRLLRLAFASYRHIHVTKGKKADRILTGY